MIASAVVVAAPSAGLATEGQAKDYQCYVYKRVPRTHTVGWFVGADARTYVPTVRMRFGAWPAQGAATTTDEGFGVARLFVACGRTNVRPYGRVRRLGRGRHKARPLQLMWVWCGRLLLLMCVRCGHSNEPNDDVRA